MGVTSQALTHRYSPSQDEAYLEKLEPVVQRLRDDVPLAKFDRRSLAQLLAQLSQFMEDALGINVRHPTCS
jgi:hypothetical protein